MNFKQTVILFAMATLSLTVVVSGQESNIELHKLLARSDANGCFKKFMNYTTAISKHFQNKYNDCHQKCDTEKANIEAAAMEKRNRLTSNAAQSCSAMGRCNLAKTAAQALYCLANQGTSGVRTMHSINTEASKYLVDVKEALRLADNEKYKCTNETKDQHQNEISQCNFGLAGCMTGTNEEWNISEEYFLSISSEKPEDTEVIEGSGSDENVEIPELIDEASANSEVSIKDVSADEPQDSKELSSHFDSLNQ